MEQLDNSSLDLTKMNIEKVKELFPSVVTEGTIDFEMLKILLGGGAMLAVKSINLHGQESACQ